MPGPVADLLGALPSDWADVVALVEQEVIHGDLHPGNIIDAEDGSPLVIGAYPRRAPWAFDAGWYEAHCLFNYPDQPPPQLIEAMDVERGRLGLQALGPDMAAIAPTVRAWYAAQLWTKQDDERRADRLRQDLTQLALSRGRS